MFDSFNDRLEFVLDGRKLTPWGKSLGLSNSVLGVMSQGTAPGPDHLKVIASAENVSLNFLLTGEGSPFVVNTPPASLDPESEVFLLSFGGMRAIVTLASACHTFERSGKAIEFQKLTVFRGIGFDTSTLDNPRYFQFPAIAELLAGKLSKHALIGKQKDGLLYLARPTLEPWTAAPSGIIDQELMRAVLVLIEKQSTGHENGALTSEQKARIISSTYAHAIRRGLTASDLNSDLINPIVDAVR